MKKSEVIYKLAKLLHRQLADLEPYIRSFEESQAEWDRDAREVLDFLEGIGMLPPFNAPLYHNMWRSGEDGYKWDEEEEDENKA